MKVSNILQTLVLLSIISSCQNEIETQTNDVNKVSVSFKSSILSRSLDSKWSSNDKIGVYMKKSNNTLSVSSIVNNGSNICFNTVNGDGYFKAFNASLEYPDDNSDVDFIAYYPYNSDVTDFTYNINVTDQTNPEKLDILYSNNLTERSAKSVTGNLQFDHLLSQLTINLVSQNNSSIDNVTATIKNVNTKAKINLIDGSLTPDNNSKGNIEMHRIGNSLIALLIPSASTSDIKIDLSCNGKTKTISLPTNIKTLKAGDNNFFNLNISNSSVIEDEADYKKWRETPVITKSLLSQENIHYINHYMPNDKKVRNYSLLYDSDLKIAYWVAYPYCSYYGGNTGRTDDWQYDPDISEDYQTDLFKNTYSMTYDRGHQIASADRLRDKESNATTFYYTNMTPQTGNNFNGAIWANLEGKVRGWGTATDTIFVVTGASPTTKEDKTIKYLTNTKDKKRIAIPKYYYKALARKVGNNFKTIAFKFDNKAYSDANSYMNYAISVSELEEETGFVFFPSLAPEIKSSFNKDDWK